MRKALKSLPGDLNETYDQILKGIEEEYLEDAFKVLNWLVHSTRPLDLAELAEVVAVNLSIDEPQFDPGSRLGEPRDVLSICSSLVTTVTRTDNSDRDGHIYQIAEVRLAHFSVKEYLLSARVRKGDIEYAVDKEDQGIMAETCLTYLLHFQEPGMLTRTYPDDYPLAEYAANYWFIHAKEAKEDVAKVNRLGLKLGQSNGAFVNWIRLRDLDGYELGDHELSNRDIDRFPETETFGSPLYYAALAGLVELSKALIANGADVNEETGNYGHALQAASIAGHPEIITLLLENGADINAKGGLRGSALHAACYKGRENIVRLLLERGAHAHLEDKKHKTPLQIAYREKENGVIKVMYEMKPSLKQDYLGNQLRAVAHSGNLDKVKALLEEGVDVNRQGGLYDSALQAASHGGHVDIVKLLLANGADVNLRSFLDFDYDTPLQAAATEGRLEIVQILLDSGADINTEGGEARTPLIAAASMGHEAVVRLLLERGADINFHYPSCLYPSALAAAAFAGSEPIVRLLLDTGINLEYCNSAISSVSDGALVLPSGLHESSWYQIVKLMHEKGGKYTPDAFRDMCRHAQLPIVNLMLETGLDFTPDAMYYHDVLKQIDEEDDFKFMRTAKVNCEEEYEAIRAIIRRNANLAK
jgi:ankyrin repeat protein